MLRSILSNWAALVILGSISFLLTPLLIHRLGDLEFGMWVLGASLAGYSGLFELGIRPTVQRYVARFRGMGDRAALDETFATGLALTLAVGALVSVASVILAHVLPGFFGLAGPRRAQFSWLVILLGASTGASLSGLLLGTYLCAFQRFDLFNLASIARHGGQAFFIVVGLLCGGGVVILGAVTLLATLGSLPLSQYLVRRVDPHLRFSVRLARWRRAKEMVQFSFWMFLNTAGAQLRSYTDSIVIARVLTLALVTPFSVAARLMEYFQPIVVSAAGPVLPAMSELDGQQKHRELQELFLKATRLTALLAFAIGSVLLLNGRTLLRVWVGEKYVSSYGLLLVLGLGYIVMLAQLAGNILLIARGRHRPFGLWTLAEGLANLGLSIYWGRKYGLMGVALGTTVPLLAVKLTLQPWYTLRVAGITAREYLSRAFARPAAVCGLFLVVSQVANLVLPRGEGLLQLLLTLAWEGLLFAALSYWLGLTSSERELLWEGGAAALKLARPGNYTRPRPGGRRVLPIGRLLKAGWGYVRGEESRAGKNVIVLPDDVFLVSYPRSGNTWTRFLVANLLHPHEPATFANIERVVPDIYVNSQVALLRAPHPRVLKSHEPFDPRYKKVVYIVRDPRDVAVSMYHWEIKRGRIRDDCPWDEYVRRFLAGQCEPLHSWEDNAASWLATRWNSAGFLLLRYEDMLEQPERELGRVADFVGVEHSENTLARAVELSSADHMRTAEKQQSRVWAPTRHTRQDIPFVRAATSGAWRSDLPDSGVRAIEAAWGPLMRLLGYSPLTDVGAGLPLGRAEVLEATIGRRGNLGLGHGVKKT